MGGVRWVMCGLITHRGPSAGDRKLRTPPSVAWPFLHAATQAGFLQPPCLCGWPLSGPSFFPSSLLRQTQGLRVPGPSLLSLKNLFSNKSQHLQIKSADFQNHCFWWQLPEPILEIDPLFLNVSARRGLLQSKAENVFNILHTWKFPFVFEFS